VGEGEMEENPNQKMEMEENPNQKMECEKVRWKRI
jgi:hypothetical protein